MVRRLIKRLNYFFKKRIFITRGYKNAWNNSQITMINQALKRIKQKFKDMDTKYDIND